MRIDTWNIEPGPQALGHSCYGCVHKTHFKLTVFTIGRNREEMDPDTTGINQINVDTLGSGPNPTNAELMKN